LDSFPYSQSSGGTVAEREGFEPSIHFWAYAPLAGECLRPLGHLSGQRAILPFDAQRRQKLPQKSVTYARLMRGAARCRTLPWAPGREGSLADVYTFRDSKVIQVRLFA